MKHLSRAFLISIYNIWFCGDFFFFFDLGFMALSRIFHLYWADHSSKVGKNRRTWRKTTWPSVSRTWLSHVRLEQGSNHSDVMEKWEKYLSGHLSYLATRNIKKIFLVIFAPNHILQVLILVLSVCMISTHKIAFWCKYEPTHDKTYNKTCVTRKDSNQPAHPCSLHICAVWSESVPSTASWLSKKG